MPKRATVVWTKPALDSLLDIVRYIRRDDPNAAQRFGRAVKSQTGRLTSFPDSGRVVPEFPVSGLREIVLGNYRIIYRHLRDEKSIEILTVRHGARLLESSSSTE
jgi:plasmid stabilization system protein ParE